MLQCTYEVILKHTSSMDLPPKIRNLAEIELRTFNSEYLLLLLVQGGEPIEINKYQIQLIYQVYIKLQDSSL